MRVCHNIERVILGLVTDEYCWLSFPELIIRVLIIPLVPIIDRENVGEWRTSFRRDPWKISTVIKWAANIFIRTFINSNPKLFCRRLIWLIRMLIKNLQQFLRYYDVHPAAADYELSPTDYAIGTSHGTFYYKHTFKQLYSVLLHPPEWRLSSREEVKEDDYTQSLRNLANKVQEMVLNSCCCS